MSNHFEALDQWLFAQPAPDKNKMVNKYGKGPDGVKCKTCKSLRKIDYHNKTYYKCAFRGDTRGPGTDHRVGWNACAKYEVKNG